MYEDQMSDENSGTTAAKNASTLFANTGFRGDAVDGLACASLTTMDTILLDRQGFMERLSGPARGGVAVLKLSPAGRTELQLVSNPPMPKGEVGHFLGRLYGLNSFDYPQQCAVLIDEPCCVVPKTGAVFLADGRPVRESIYPSSGDQTFHRLIGGVDCGRDEFLQLLVTAPLVDMAAVPALLLSRWSSVYTHAVVESLTHDAALRRLGVTALTSYLVPTVLDGCQSLVVAEAARRGVAGAVHEAPVLRVPRVVVSSLLYEYATYGECWNGLVAELLGDCNSGGSTLVYASRIGAAVRPMENEVMLASELVARGFTVFSGQGHTLAEQVQAYSAARMIVGPHGSGLLNAGFARPGTTLFELRPLNRPGQNPMWDTSFMRMSAGRGLAYLAHVSANPAETERWTADLPAILAEVDRLLPALG